MQRLHAPPTPVAPSPLLSAVLPGWRNGRRNGRSRLATCLASASSQPQAPSATRAFPNPHSCALGPPSPALDHIQQPTAIARAQPQPRQATPVSARLPPPCRSPAAANLWVAKRRLLQAVDGTQRGGEASRGTRGEVEEAQVAVEAFAGPELDFALLEGKWRLEYTTASDVLPLVRPPHSLQPLAPVEVGRIYQRFSSLSEGRAENIIEVVSRLPAPLAGVGLCLVVEAGYEPRTARSIALSFKGAGARDVQLSPALQNFIASPLLPRGWLQLQALQWLQQLSVSVPFLPRPPFLNSNRPGPVGFNYLLTYLDSDMLIGRAQGNGGTFIFSREVEQQAGVELEGQETDLIM